jgi:alpha/beta superfamily hydrolase
MNNITQLPAAKFKIEEQMDIFKTKQKLTEYNSLINRCSRTASDLFSILFFPIGIARCIVSFTKQIAPFVILPASWKFNIEKKSKQYEKAPSEELKKEIEQLITLNRQREEFIADPSNHAEQTTLRTVDEVDLDTLSIYHPKQIELAPAEQKWIVYLNGNATCFEQHLKKLQLFSEKNEANILTGNYRGVMRSKGKVTSSHDQIVDGETMVQYLLNKGVPAKNILIHGWSLGGAVSVAVASHHQETGNEMHLCSESSFANFKEVLSCKIPAFLAMIVNKILFSAGWQFDGVKSYQKIKGHKIIIYSKEDGVINYQASLYKCLKEQQRIANNQIKKQDLKFETVSKDRYKPENVLLFSAQIEEDGRSLTREEVIKKYGTTVHCYPLEQMEDVFKLYVDNVKKALRIRSGNNE